MTWIPAFRVPAASGQATCAPPPSFPDGIELYQQGFQNWSKRMVIDDLWTCAPRSAEDVVRLANWAHRHGWKLRARGAMHNWSPICVTPDVTCDSRVVLADTRQHLTDVKVLSGKPAAVRADAGVTMLEMTERLEAAGLGLAGLPATGDITVAGGLAIGVHGATVGGRNEQPKPGQTFGSLANLVVSLTAVVWSRRRGRYVLRTFDRSELDTKALLVHLGRTFITSVTLRVGVDDNLRCVSHLDIPWTELFAQPGSSGRTFESFIEDAGRAEAIWLPFTENPWFKVWSVAPSLPAGSRVATEPFNYPFSDNMPEPVTDLIDEIVTGNGAATPLFGQTQYEAVVVGLTALDAYDLWGPSRNTLFYIKQTTLRVDALGYAVVTKRSNIQRVLSQFAARHVRRLEELRAAGQFPVNGPVEIRISGIDQPTDVGVPGAEAPSIAATSPRRANPDWDVTIWINVLMLPGSPGQAAYCREMERWMRSKFRGYAVMRPEWSKTWAATNDDLWADGPTLKRLIPRNASAGRRADENWEWTRKRLNHHDPHRIFSNDFLDRLLPG